MYSFLLASDRKEADVPWFKSFMKIFEENNRHCLKFALPFQQRYLWNRKAISLIYLHRSFFIVLEVCKFIFKFKTCMFIASFKLVLCVLKNLELVSSSSECPRYRFCSSVGLVLENSRSVIYHVPVFENSHLWEQQRGLVCRKSLFPVRLF